MATEYDRLISAIDTIGDVTGQCPYVAWCNHGVRVRCERKSGHAGAHALADTECFPQSPWVPNRRGLHA